MTAVQTPIGEGSLLRRRLRWHRWRLAWAFAFLVSVALHIPAVLIFRAGLSPADGWAAMALFQMVVGVGATARAPVEPRRLLCQGLRWSLRGLLLLVALVSIIVTLHPTPFVAPFCLEEPSCSETVPPLEWVVGIAARLVTAGVPILSMTYAAALADSFGLRSTRNLLLGVVGLWLVVVAHFLPPGFPFPLFLVVFVIAVVGGVFLWLGCAFLLVPGRVEAWKEPASRTAILLVELRGGPIIIYQGDSLQVCVDRQRAVAMLRGKGAFPSGDYTTDVVSPARKLRMLVGRW